MQCFSPARHHFISYPERVCFEEVLSSWRVCVFLAALWWIEEVVFIFCLYLKRILSFFSSLLFHIVWMHRHTWMENSVCSPVLWYFKHGFYKLLRYCLEEKSFDNMNWNWFFLDHKCSNCYYYTCLDQIYIHLSIFFALYFSLIWLLMTGLKMKSDGEVYLKATMIVEGVCWIWQKGRRACVLLSSGLNEFN